MINSRLKQIFAIAGLVYMTGALTFLLTPSGAEDAPSVRLLGIVIGGLAGLSLLLRPDIARTPISVYVPMALVIGFALLSTLWSVDFALALRRSGALILTATFAVWLAETFTGRAIVNMMLWAAFLVVVASYVAIFAFPQFGLQQAVSGLSETYVGAWRGMYNHKNDFGRMAALTSILFVTAALFRKRRRGICLLAALLAIGLVAGSRSSQAIIITVLGSSVAIASAYLRQRTPAERAMALLILIPFSVILFFLYNYVTEEVLKALGKDASLSDRTEIWAVVIRAMRDNLVLGGGYGAGWGLVNDAVLQRFGRSFGHAHNGYLHLGVQVGIVGVLLFLAVYLRTTALAFRQFMRGRNAEFSCIWLAYSAYFLAGNMAASYLLKYNTIDMVMFVIGPSILLRHSSDARYYEYDEYSQSAENIRSRYAFGRPAGQQE